MRRRKMTSASMFTARFLAGVVLLLIAALVAGGWWVVDKSHDDREALQQEIDTLTDAVQDQAEVLADRRPVLANAVCFQQRAAAIVLYAFLGNGDRDSGAAAVLALQSLYDPSLPVAKVAETPGGIVVQPFDPERPTRCPSVPA